MALQEIYYFYNVFFFNEEEGNNFNLKEGGAIANILQ